MSRNLQAAAAVVAFALFAGCGPGAKIASNKQAAAEALHSATGPTNGGAGGLALSADCRFGGKTSLQGFQQVFNLGGTNVNVAQQFTVGYQNCAAVETSAGVAVLNGTWTVTQAVNTTSGSAEVEQSVKGRLLFQGALNDFLDADIVQRVSASALTATSGGVSMVLKGTLTDSSGTYSYDESVSVTAGSLSVTINSN